MYIIEKLCIEKLAHTKIKLCNENRVMHNMNSGKSLNTIVTTSKAVALFKSPLQIPDAMAGKSVPTNCASDYFI